MCGRVRLGKRYRWELTRGKCILTNMLCTNVFELTFLNAEVKTHFKHVLQLPVTLL